MQISLRNRCVAECFGTFWLVFGGCGAALFAAAFPSLGIGFLGVAFAFGLTVLTMAYAIGHISGCHLNPAVTLGLVAGKRFPAKEILPYWIAQVVGALVASGVLYIIFTGRDTWALNGFAANGYGVHSPGGYNLLACLLAEMLLTFFFILVILGSTDERAAKGLAPLAIGLCLTLIHLISIPITNTSVNPARSTGPAIVVAAGGDFWALGQLWLFWIAPLIGGLLAGLFYNAILAEHLPPPVAEKPITFSA
ncbi:MAG TPA: aquaporin Z [Acidobacteriaceae bacterium]|jgi:aquaporin Z|nr:aquaporin Z [Acidobacteriaceae bacterium]